MRTLFGVFGICAFLLSGSAAWAQDANGVMMVVKGDVKVIGAKDGKAEAAKVGRKVFAGDAITAGPDSRAKIVMSDKNILNISPDSKVVIEKYSNDTKNDSRTVELKVEYGKVRATVEQKYDGEKNKFNIKTPTAVAGVRGTDFITGFNATTRQSSIITFSGTVAVGTPGPGGSIANPVFVRPGQETKVGEGAKPEAPKSVPKDQLNNMNNETKAETAKNGNSTSGQDGGRQPASEGKKDDAAKKDDSPKKGDGGSGSSGGGEPIVSPPPPPPPNAKDERNTTCSTCDLPKPPPPPLGPCGAIPCPPTLQTNTRTSVNINISK